MIETEIQAARRRQNLWKFTAKRLTFHPEDDRTNRIVPFETTRAYDHLEFVCEYSPKTISDPELVSREVQKGIEKSGWSGRKLFPTDMTNAKCS